MACSTLKAFHFVSPAYNRPSLRPCKGNPPRTCCRRCSRIPRRFHGLSLLWTSLRTVRTLSPLSGGSAHCIPSESLPLTPSLSSTCVGRYADAIKTKGRQLAIWNARYVKYMYQNKGNGQMLCIVSGELRYSDRSGLRLNCAISI